jgi:hypothetical protein
VSLIASAAVQERRVWQRVLITLITIEVIALTVAGGIPAVLARIFR